MAIGKAISWRRWLGMRTSEESKALRPVGALVGTDVKVRSNIRTRAIRMFSLADGASHNRTLPAIGRKAHRLSGAPATA